MCSHHIPFISSQIVPQDITNSTSVLSYKVCPKFNSHVYKLKSYVVGEHICSYFVTGVQKVLLLRSTQYSQKKLVMGQSTWLVQNKEQKCECTHELINMNYANNLVFNSNYLVNRSNSIYALPKALCLSVKKKPLSK
jgi:hypothetical protein